MQRTQKEEKEGREEKEEKEGNERKERISVKHNDDFKREGVVLEICLQAFTRLVAVNESLR